MATARTRRYVIRSMSLLSDAGVETHGVRIALLCMPRVLGYEFNPLSIYYCSDAQGRIVAMVYEVNNTFHQRHTYVIAVTPPADRSVVQSSAKRFYVSPFLDVDMSYTFSTLPPGRKVRLSIMGFDTSGPLINTALAGSRRPLTDRTLARLLLAFPLLTLKVIGVIHWHALRMWLKGFKIKDQPSTPRNGTTVIRNNS